MRQASQCSNTSPRRSPLPSLRRSPPRLVGGGLEQCFCVVNDYLHVGDQLFTGAISQCVGVHRHSPISSAHRPVFMATTSRNFPLTGSGVGATSSNVISTLESD